jgi:hypothetical protein
MTPTNFSLLGRLGAFTTHSRHDVRQLTANARKTFLSNFERQVDPDNLLPLPERLRRAQAARKAFFCRLALRSAEVRRQRARRRKNGGAS